MVTRVVGVVYDATMLSRKQNIIGAKLRISSSKQRQGESVYLTEQQQPSLS